ncbi:MAG: hypothetical protein GXO56_00380 [Chloroflexi bacterium]|nr:hypothetical protein [Chloroflexota bacterium]
MSPHRPPRYKLWNVYYGPCHNINTKENGSARSKYYIIVRICERHVHCALIGSKQSQIPVIRQCQMPIEPKDIIDPDPSGAMIHKQSWLSVHTKLEGGHLFTLPRYVQGGHKRVGKLSDVVIRAVSKLIEACENIEREHKDFLLGEADC